MKVIVNFVYAIIGFMHYVMQLRQQDVKLTPTEQSFERSIMVNSNVFEIHYLPDMNKLGIFFAGFLKLANGKKYIIIDKHFKAFPEDYQEALIQHEIGHIVSGHMDGRAKEIYQSFVDRGRLVVASLMKSHEKVTLIQHTMALRHLSHEYQADMYAVNQCGAEATLGALRMLAVMVSEPGRDELFKRYEYINGTSMLADGTFAIIRNAFLEGVRSAWSDAKVISLETLEE